MARSRDEYFLFSNEKLKDEELFNVLLDVKDYKIRKIAFTNAVFTDPGFVMISDFMKRNPDLTVLKLFNNLKVLVLSGDQELPFLFHGTKALGEAFSECNKIETLELHGCFFDLVEFEHLSSALSRCDNLKKLTFSNNNLTDRGCAHIANVIFEGHRMTALSLYNNNITSIGAFCLVEALRKNNNLNMINMEMNMIKDDGVVALVEGIDEGAFHLWRLNLANN